MENIAEGLLPRFELLPDVKSVLISTCGTIVRGEVIINRGKAIDRLRL